MSSEHLLSVKGLVKKYGQMTALDRVSLDIRHGEFMCVLGPSGCGKTTMLRIIAGLEEQDGGAVWLGGEDISRWPASRRNFGIVFQSYALFPNLTAAQNVAYGLKGKLPRKEIAGRVRELIELVGLTAFADKYPAKLSGGQQQRVALARALALSPRALLLDEPLSALDARVRERLRREIRRLQERLGLTVVMVTHDQEEALTMADRVVVMNQARIIQVGTPREIYETPADVFVADFVGAMNFIPEARTVGDSCLDLGAFRLSAANGCHGERATVAIRPEDVRVMPDADQPNVVMARVDGLEFRGSFYRLSLSLGEVVSLDVDMPSERLRRLGIRKDMALPVQLPSERLLLFS